jgi:hypothetical protein
MYLAFLGVGIGLSGVLVIGRLWPLLLAIPFVVFLVLLCARTPFM